MSRRSPTSCCRRRRGASTPTRARTSSAGCASTSSSTTRPGEVRAEYLIFVAIAQRLAQRHGLSNAAEWQFGAGRTSSARCGRRRRARRSGSTTSRRERARRARNQRDPAADTPPGQEADRHRAHLRGQVRHRGRPRPLRRPRLELDRRRSARVPARGDQAERAVPVLRHHGPLPDGLAVGLHVPLAATTSPTAACRSWSSSCTRRTPARPA